MNGSSWWMLPVRTPRSRSPGVWPTWSRSEHSTISQISATLLWPWPRPTGCFRLTPMNASRRSWPLKFAGVSLIPRTPAPASACRSRARSWAGRSAFRERSRTFRCGSSVVIAGAGPAWCTRPWRSQAQSAEWNSFSSIARCRASASSWARSTITRRSRPAICTNRDGGFRPATWPCARSGHFSSSTSASKDFATALRA